MDDETCERGLRNGAFPLAGGRTWFSVRAPRAGRVQLLLDDELTDTLEPLADGYAAGTFPELRGRPAPLDDRGPSADPASRSQPEAGPRSERDRDDRAGRGFGRRLADELPFEAQFPIVATVLLGGWVPLRFMGEEYGETAPLHSFIDHGDPELDRAVRDGSRRWTRSPWEPAGS